MVNRYWTSEELHELGEFEEPEELSIEEFNTLLSSTGSEELDRADFENVQFREVSLGDAALFEIQIGRRARKEEAQNGEIPCVSANVHDIFGYVSESAILDNDWSRPSILLGVDGTFDWRLIEAGKKFHPTDHCGVLRIRAPEIDAEYLWYALRATRERYGFDRTYRAKFKNIAELSVSIPVSDDGIMDIDLQRQMAAKYREVEDRRARAKSLLGQIVNARVTIDEIW